jgi:stage V sporulation protein G
MNKGNWGKIRAFFDLQTEDGFIIKGFKLIEGINGLFVGFPSQKGSDDEYHDTVWADRDIKEGVNQLAIKTYGQEVMSPMSSMEDHDNFPPPPESDESAVPMAVPFSDDDIPF